MKSKRGFQESGQRPYKGRGLKVPYLGFPSQLLLLLVLLMGCSGYQLKRSQNPLGTYGIRTLGIRSFINRTALPQVSMSFTNAMMTMLASYPALKLTTANYDRADALLIGVVRSPQKRSETIRPVETLFTDAEQDLQDQLGDRAGFYAQNRSEVRLILELTLIRDPKRQDLEELSAKEAKKDGMPSFLKKKNPKIMAQVSLPLQKDFSRVIYGAEGREVNATQNAYALHQTLEHLATLGAKQFEDLVLNAF